MSEFLVPYTFTAGTKAKASEVNANFTACKTALDSNTSDIEDINTNLGNCIRSDGSINFERLESYRKRTVTLATNASPIVITSASHGFLTGSLIYISGVVGNTSANGKWVVTKIDNDTFSLNNSVGNGTYTSGGSIYLLPNVDEGLAPKKYVDINASRVITQIGTCSTASATTEKAVILSGFELQAGATILVTFTNKNTVDAPTLNVNSTGARTIYNESGVAVSANNPAYFPTGSTVEFTYDGTNWVFKKRELPGYVNGTSWYRQWTDGWIEQGGYCSSASQGTGTTISLLLSFKNTNYSVLLGNQNANNFPNLVWGTKATNNLILYSSSGYSASGNWEAKGY